MNHIPHSQMHPDLAGELRTIEKMILIYCCDHHQSGKTALCADCEVLRNYAEIRLLHCPFQENKPTCGNCAVHCYKKDMRERVKEIMRYSGPRMIFKHPVMAFRHLLASRREAPTLKQIKSAGKTTT